MMPVRRALLKNLILALILSLAFYGCADDDDDDEEADPEVLDEIAVALANTINVVGQAVTAASEAETGAVNRTVNCTESGQLTVRGALNRTPPAFQITNGTVGLNNCNDLDGSLTLNAEGTSGQNQFEFDATVNGNVDNDCRITLAQFREEVTIRNNITSGTLNGTLNANCGDDGAICTFNLLPFDNRGVSRATLAELCTPNENE